ncbi:MAG: hypothetical protein GTO22_00715 [Gemmatimonadales bacterium]|nr:hypothetical protein [Gemmatimonadales bacterium]
MESFSSSRISLHHLSQQLPIAIQHMSPPRHIRAWIRRCRKVLVGAVNQLGAVASAVVRRVRGLSPERLFWAVMVLLLLLYVLVLLIQPSSAPQAGR